MPVMKCGEQQNGRADNAESAGECGRVLPDNAAAAERNRGGYREVNSLQTARPKQRQNEAGERKKSRQITADGGFTFLPQTPPKSA